MRIDSTISAIVTGGASGLGKATVIALRAAGAKVAIFDLNPDNGHRVAEETGSIFCEADILSDDTLDGAFAKAAAAQGPARVLIACAGGGSQMLTLRQDRTTGEFKRFPTADFARCVALNAVGTFATLTRFAEGAAGLDLVDGERGTAVMVASVAAQEGQAGQVAYSAGKGAILGMTLPVARDLARFGIRVNTILPGIMDTEGFRQAPQDLRDRLVETVAFPKRFGDVAEFASLALEICRNGYLNAQTFRLDGGIRFAAR